MQNSSLVRAVAGRASAPLASLALALSVSACTPSSLSLPDAGLQPGTAPVAARTPTPDNQQPSLAQARALRSAGKKAEAMAMLDKLVEASPGDKAVRKEHALVSLEIGQLAKAERLLAAQIDPKAPDWHIHSAYGAALAAQGKYRQAQAEFARALEIAPDHPAILNNQALAYALEGRRTDAERLLRRITDSRSSDARAGKAKQNLALLLGLEGRAEEARKMGESVLPPEQARSNAELLTMAPAAPSLARADDKGGGDRTLMRVGASTIAP